MTVRDAEGKALDLRLIRVIINAVEVLYTSLERAIDSYGPSMETFRIFELLYNKGPGDRRKTNVALTEEGRRYFDNIFLKHVQKISDNLSFATDEEKLELIQVLKKIGYGIKNREGDANNDGGI